MDDEEDGEIGYKIDDRISDPNFLPLSQSSLSKNKFVHLALERTLTLASQLRGSKALQERLSHDLAITIVGDNDFYSQRAQVCLLPQFHE